MRRGISRGAKMTGIIIRKVWNGVHLNLEAEQEQYWESLRRDVSRKKEHFQWTSCRQVLEWIFHYVLCCLLANAFRGGCCWQLFSVFVGYIKITGITMRYVGVKLWGWQRHPMDNIHHTLIKIYKFRANGNFTVINCMKYSAGRSLDRTTVYLIGVLCITVLVEHKCTSYTPCASR